LSTGGKWGKSVSPGKNNRHLVDLQTNAKGEFEGTSDPAYDFVTDRHESLRRQMQTLATVFSNKIRDISNGEKKC